MFYPLCVLLVVWVCWVSYRHGPRQAIWWGWFPALMLPTFSYRTWGPVGIDLISVAAGSVLICYRGRLSKPHSWLLILDVVFVAYLTALVLSEILNGAGMVASLIETTRRFGVPYVLGRLAYSRYQREAERTSEITAVCGVCLVLSAAALLEAITHVNLIAMVFGREDGYLTRWSVRRASGPADHPLGLAALFVCFLPWCVEGFRRAYHGQGRAWWMVTPFAAAVGILVTASRMSLIAPLIGLVVGLVILKPRLRPAIIATSVGLALVLSFVDLGNVSHLANRLGQEREGLTFLLGGKEYNYTGTNHRYLQFVVYQDVIARTGWWGVGQDGMNDFRLAAKKQIYVPGIPLYVPPVFYSIDSHYLYFLLERGWFGLSLWCLVCLVAIASIWHAPSGYDLPFRALLAGGIVSVAFLLLTVFQSPPFEGLLMFMVGLIGSWRQHFALRPPAETQTETSVGGPLRPVSSAATARRLRLAAASPRL